MPKSRNGLVVNLISSATATGAGTAKENPAHDGKVSFMATGTTSAGSGACAVKVQVCNFPSSVDGDWLTLGTISLTLGTTSTSDGFTMEAAWPYIRGNVDSISGTDASVTLRMAGG